MVVIACGAIAKEILELKRLNNWDFDLTCIPAQYHNTPKKIPDAVRQKIIEARANKQEVFVAFADCGTGGMLDKVLEEYNVERLPGAHCYQFFAGGQAFLEMHEQELGTLYLTDFLARHFDAFIIKGLGLDRYPDMRDMIFGNYKRLVYLAQNPTDDLIERAQAGAARLGLAYEYRFTGYGELETALTKTLSNQGETYAA